MKIPSNYFAVIEKKAFDWGEVQNVAEPEHYTDDFSSDKGYFTEENGAHDRSIENGILRLENRDEFSLTYLHIYEKNVTVKARLRYSAPNPPDATFGIMLRYTAISAFVRCVYYAKSQFFAIDTRVDEDSDCIREIKKPCVLEEGKWYDIEFTVDGNTAELKIDGETFIKAEGIAHLTPGRVALFANRMTLECDSFDAAFLSGQGVLWKNVIHHKLPDEKYREGGSVFEMKDGTLIYTHHSGATFESKNRGETWERREKWTDTYGYVNILRLRNGDFIKITTRTEDGVQYKSCETSSDDGLTWTRGGDICTVKFRGDTCALAGNMNDKVTQISDGRIFYCQNYETRPYAATVDGRSVFCEFYYSDDNGKTWIKSETDSWELGDNNVQWFGECKILECADGTLRMYNSWNDYGCVVYSESADRGVTWGPLVPMPELVCARSSMQFWRDPYADNETTYYMVWVYSPPMAKGSPMTRSRLSLARSEDGKNWDFLGDIWRWEHSNVKMSHIAHIVDAFIKTTKDYVICGAGYSEHLEREEAGDFPYHHAQRQHVYSIRKDGLVPVPLKPVR